jgi:hypothetical protein
MCVCAWAFSQTAPVEESRSTTPTTPGRCRRYACTAAILARIAQENLAGEAGQDGEAAADGAGEAAAPVAGAGPGPSPAPCAAGAAGEESSPQPASAVTAAAAAPSRHTGPAADRSVTGP